MLKQGAMVQVRFTVNVILYVAAVICFVLFSSMGLNNHDDFIPEDLFVMSAGMDCTMFFKTVNK